MGKTLANKPRLNHRRRHSIHNNLKAKLAHLVHMLDFNQDKPEILDAKIWKYKVELCDFIAALNTEEAKFLATNDYYYCIIKRIGDPYK